MFGGFDFGEPYFADELGIIAPAPRPVKPVPLRTLVVPCRTRACDDISHDNDRNGLGNYDLQAVAVAATTPTPVVECRKRVCADISGVGPFSALTIYSLQDALFFNGTELSFIVDCPVGYTCDPGTFPIEFRYPPGRFYIPPPDRTPGFPVVISLQGCTSMVTLVLPSGSSTAAISAASQQVINQVAAQQALCDAQQIAKKNPVLITLSDLPTDFCLGTSVALSVTASYTPHTTPTTFTLDSNQLPPGVNVSQNTTTMFLTGTPTTPGTYVFTVTATAPNASGSKTYSISVVGIVTPSPLPDAFVSSPYSQTLDGSSMSGVLSWSVVAGTLPTWMNLNSTTGSLFGTPAPGDDGITNDFTISVTNGAVSCQKDFSITTDAVATGCASFVGLTWDSGFNFSDATASASGSFSGNSGSGSTFQPGTVYPNNAVGGIIFYGTMSYLGSGSVTCCVKGTINASPAFSGAEGSFANSFVQVQVNRNGVNILFDFFFGAGGLENWSFPFTVLGAGFIEVWVMFVSQGSVGFPDPIDAPGSNATYTAQIGTC